MNDRKQTTYINKIVGTTSDIKKVLDGDSFSEYTKEMQRLELINKNQNIELRKAYVDNIFTFICFYMIAVFIIVYKSNTSVNFYR